MSQNNISNTDPVNENVQGTVVKIGKISTDQAQSYIAQMLGELKSIARAQGLENLSDMISLTHKAAQIGLTVGNPTAPD